MADAPEHYIPPADETIRLNPQDKTHVPASDDLEGKQAYNRTAYKDYTNEEPLQRPTPTFLHRRICGCPMFLFLILMTLFLGGAIAGGVVGGIASNDNHNRGQALDSNGGMVEGAEDELSTMTSTSSTSTSTVPSSACTTEADIPLLSDRWYGIKNNNYTGDTTDGIWVDSYYPRHLNSSVGSLSLNPINKGGQGYMAQDWQFLRLRKSDELYDLGCKVPENVVILYWIASAEWKQNIRLGAGHGDLDWSAYEKGPGNHTRGELYLRPAEDVRDDATSQLWYLKPRPEGEGEGLMELYNYKIGPEWRLSVFDANKPGMVSEPPDQVEAVWKFEEQGEIDRNLFPAWFVVS